MRLRMSGYDVVRDCQSVIIEVLLTCCDLCMVA